jgi:hypothetical protein
VQRGTDVKSPCRTALEELGARRRINPGAARARWAKERTNNCPPANRARPYSDGGIPPFREMTKTGEIMTGLNYGVLLIAWGVAGTLGPLLGGRVCVATGEYRLAFYIPATLSLAALAILSIAESSTTRELRATG